MLKCQFVQQIKLQKSNNFFLNCNRNIKKIDFFKLLCNKKSPFYFFIVEKKRFLEIINLRSNTYMRLN